MRIQMRSERGIGDRLVDGVEVGSKERDRCCGDEDVSHDMTVERERGGVNT